MASRIRTALLTTAVASGLLLTNAPAQAQGIDAAVATQRSETTPSETWTTTPSYRGEGVDTESSFVQDGPSSNDVEVPAMEPKTGDTTKNDIDEAAASGAGDETEDLAVPPETTLPAGISPVPFDGLDGSDETDVQGSSEESTQSISTPDETLTIPGESEETEKEEVPVIESGKASIESAESTEPTIEESDEPTSFWELVEDIEAPEGSESWSEEEWIDFLETPEGMDFTDQMLDGLVGTEEFDTIVDIVVDFMESGDEAYLDELMDYFLFLFDGNEEWAMEAYNGVIQELINGGFLDEEEAPPADEGASTESPEAAPSVEKPVVKPAGNITKPVVDKKAVAESVIKPLAATANPQLAETGSNSVVVFGGAGLLLVMIGALTLRLRRKPRAH
jgi:LPXTG-motif cell wall-anchored protein